MHINLMSKGHIHPFTMFVSGDDHVLVSEIHSSEVYSTFC